MRTFGRRQIAGLLALLAVTAGLVLLRLLVYRTIDGALSVSWPAPEVARFRTTAVAVAVIAGGSLAVSGVLLQALLRNPLASPFILGISSGAALGVTIAIAFGSSLGRAALDGTATTGPAVIGGVATLGVVYVLGQRRGWLDPISLVLVGVIVSAICAAVIMFIQHLLPLSLRGHLVTWMMGHIDQGATAGALLVTGAIAVAGTVIAARLGRAMDAATLGDDEARSVGLALGPLRVVMFLLAGALTSGAVALAGPIGFVGLVAPHAARLLIGPRHAVLVLAAALVGMSLLVLGDVAAQVILVEGGRMPVGVFTALVGGPAFIWLLRSGRGQS